MQTTEPAAKATEVSYDIIDKVSDFKISVIGSRCDSEVHNGPSKNLQCNFFMQGCIKEPICLTHMWTMTHIAWGSWGAIDGCITCDLPPSVMVLAHGQ